MIAPKEFRKHAAEWRVSRATKPIRSDGRAWRTAGFLPPNSPSTNISTGRDCRSDRCIESGRDGRAQTIETEYRVIEPEKKSIERDKKR